MGVITGNYLPANSKMKNKIHKHIKMWAFTWNPSRVVTENANKWASPMETEAPDYPVPGPSVHSAI